MYALVPSTDTEKETFEGQHEILKGNKLAILATESEETDLGRQVKKP